MYKLHPQNTYMQYIARIMLKTVDNGTDEQWRVVGNLKESPLLTKENRDVLQRDYIKLSFKRLRRLGEKFEKSLKKARR